MLVFEEKEKEEKIKKCQNGTKNAKYGIKTNPTDSPSHPDSKKYVTCRVKCELVGQNPQKPQQPLKLPKTTKKPPITITNTNQPSPNHHQSTYPINTFPKIYNILWSSCFP